jgi:sugar lactone lactonase YvrE
VKRSLFAALGWLIATAAARPAWSETAANPDSMMRAARDTTRATPDTTSAARDSTTLPFKLTPRGEIAAQGSGRGQVVEPAGIACDPFGRIWVSDAQLHNIQRFERDGHWLGENGLLGSGEGELRRPGSIALLGAADMGVLDQENRRVVDFDLFGRLQGTRLDLQDPALEEVTGRVDPTALATDRGGALYVADPARERVLVFDTGGRFERALGEFGSKPGQLRGLQGLASAPHGELVVTERLNARVQRIDAGGRSAAAWALPVDPRANGALPVAVDAQGRVAVADESSGRLWVFDAAGHPAAALASLGRPRALAFAPDGTLLVTETRPARVRRFALVATGP